MNERDFEMLKVLSEMSNITKAAEKLCITQSALSKRIKALEDELGVQLLKRSRGGTTLTTKGEIVLKYSYGIADKLIEMKQELNDISGQVEGILNAGISIDQTRSYIADLLCEYRILYPNVQQNIKTGKSEQLYDMFINNTLDLALIRGDFPWSGYKALIHSEHVCLVSGSKEITESTCIWYTTDQYMNMLVSRWLQENGLIVNKNRICVDSISVCMELVKKGLGWCVLPEAYVKEYQEEAVYCYFKDGTPILRNTYLYIQPNALKLPQVKAFSELLNIYNMKTK